MKKIIACIGTFFALVALSTQAKNPYLLQTADQYKAGVIKLITAGGQCYNSVFSRWYHFAIEPRAANSFIQPIDIFVLRCKCYFPSGFVIGAGNIARKKLNPVILCWGQNHSRCMVLIESLIFILCDIRKHRTILHMMAIQNTVSV